MCNLPQFILATTRTDPLSKKDAKVKYHWTTTTGKNSLATPNPSPPPPPQHKNILLEAS